MISKTENVTLQENADMMNLENVIQKLGKNGPATLSNEEDDYRKRRDYVRNVISTAKSNVSLFSSEEMGHILAADFLMQATADDEDNKEFDLKSVTTRNRITSLPEMDPALKAALSVVAEVIKKSGSYQEALRAGVIAIEGCIPYVGGIIAAITSIFWPENKKDVWDQVKDQVNKVVQNAIFENEYKIVASQITAVKTGLNQYLNSPSKEEQRPLLIANMLLINSLYERVNQSKYRHMLIGLMVPIGVLHLTVLSERYNHYKVLFGSDDRTQALEDLKKSYENYKVFFDTVYVEWKNWRSGQLEVFFNSNHVLWNTVYSYGVNDGLGLYNFRYDIDDKSRANDFKEWALNRCIADMAEVLSATQTYSTLFKGIDVTLSPILPELDTIVLGHYFWTRFKDTGNMRNTMIGNWSTDKPTGDVKKINIYAYNSIDGLQFLYPDMPGTKVTGGGGASFELNLDGKQCIGAKMDYSSGLVYMIQFFFADGSSSPAYGNKGGWHSIASVDATVGKSYKLAFANFALGSGPSGTKGINGVIFTFKRA